MKTDLINLLKTSLLACLLITFTTAEAQLVRKPKSQSTAKAKPSITSPAAGSTIDGPFVMVGKAEPNSYVNLYVTPIYKEPSSKDGKPILIVSSPKHKQQHFSVKADDNGVWQSPIIEVLFDSKVTDRRIFAFVSQTWGTERYESKNMEYMVSSKMIIKTVPVRVATKGK
ncbi:hypothetical protein [Pedobacter ureilyticus]|uniref:Uncharacterized protein n=1 Tax=Pedobacter ureilyticus TaxID=1393051 RepID=A0ABW9JC36_9SPHI|nr:hypothetical protein [Pedobacter helvus]